MTHYPDFSSHGYQIERELSQNFLGGRVTYLAKSSQTKAFVILKQFQFARSSTQWSEYETYETEVNILKQLDHPGIPKYIDSFETSRGFCLVQEYKPALSLANSRHWTPEEIKQIAVGVLQILVYLQQQDPPILHRDLKPENILVDRGDRLKVYAIDFGFARINSGELTASSVVKGTLGFMPPEQMFNRQLTVASDLYSLGATLICLLAQIKSSEIGNLINSDTARLEFHPFVKNISQDFVDWLTNMTAPQIKDRYVNAAEALTVIESIDPTGVSSGISPPINPPASINRIDLIFISAIAVFTTISVGIFLIPKNIKNYLMSASEIASRSTELMSEIQNLRDLEQYSSALTLTDELIELNPESSEAWIKKCVLLQRAKNSLSALNSCDRAISINPNYDLAWLERGFALINLKRHQEAYETFQKALQIENSDRAWFGRGRSLYYLGKYQDALTSFDKALKIASNRKHFLYSDVLYYQAKTFDKLQRHEEAISAIDRLPEIDPNKYYYLIQKSEFLNQVKQYREALEVLDKALAIRADEPWGWYWRGIALEGLKRDREAIDSYDKASKLYSGWSKPIQKRDALKSKLGI